VVFGGWKANICINSHVQLRRKCREFVVGSYARYADNFVCDNSTLGPNSQG